MNDDEERNGFHEVATTFFWLVAVALALLIVTSVT